ncbi:MAG: tRNA (guanosine(37)-N1)-methyltransferase TrmD [Clostridiales bacterium]|nr:tRNA (guanosine(37)-N1)-methyltransferase TrmD [Clostridiales bacterium]
MRVDIMTLFPDTVAAVMNESIIGRAQDRGYITIKCHNIRDFTLNKQKQVDDYPYGGGTGMIMNADPLYNCWKHILSQAEGEAHTILMSPQGKRFVQEDAKRLATYGWLILVCGHYEGIDERFIEECVDEEISLGDFVLTGGEIPAMAVCDAVCRLVPGVLASEESYKGESHWNGLLEYPQYTRPEVWHGKRVPEILLSGHHANIQKWRREQQLLRTLKKRPDMLKDAPLTEADREFLRKHSDTV